MLYVGSFKAIGPVSAFRPNCSAKPFYDPPVMIPRYQHKCTYLQNISTILKLQQRFLANCLRGNPT